MSQIRRFPFLPAEIPEKKIMKRLGYHSRKTEMSNDISNIADEWIRKAAEAVSLTAACRVFGIERVETGLKLRETGERIRSGKLAEFLADAGGLLMMGITGGSQITQITDELQSGGRMTEAVIFDAAASEIVDEGFNRLMEIYSRDFLREGRRLTVRRFSAGYGDFDISFQGEIFRLLELDRLGIEINESFVLKPEKSVTAVCGII